MAKKQNTPPKPKPAVAANPQVQKQQTNSTTKNQNSAMKKYAHLLMLAGIAVVTYIFYAGSLNNQMTNWDDLGYVLTNPLIKDSSTEGLKRLFELSSTVMGNYHPLTIVTYWYEYGKYGLEPHMYHVHSLLFHILCTATVFGFVRVLTRSSVAALVAGLLFALHPMRVESVTWVAGRKDLLYGMFYMLACTAHIWYIRNEGGKKMIWYASAIVLFALSLMCKSVGVTLPVVLLLIDYYENRRLSLQLLIEKLPLFALSVTFGLISIHAQKDIGALGTLDVSFNPLERLALGCYGLCTYLWKLIAPVGLTNFYPYPAKVNDALPAAFYLYPVVVVGLLFVLWKYFRQNRLVLLGVGFFVINLLLLLQFMPVGGAVMSDRYTYIPYAGLFLIIGSIVGQLVDNKRPSANVALGVCVAASLMFGVVTQARNKDWCDSISLWNSAIKNNPESPIAYFYLGQDYYTRFEGATTQQDRQRYGDSAYYYFVQSVQRKPDYTSPLVCIGEYQRSTGRIDEAKTTYLKALAIKDNLESAYLGLAVVYSMKQQYDSAGPAFRKALSLKAYFPEGYSNYANFLDIVGKPDSAIIVYQKAIDQNPDAYIPYMNRARIYLRLNKPAEAVKDLDRACMLKPEMADPYYLRAQAHARNGNKTQALKDIEDAKQRGTKVDPAFYELVK